MIAGIRKRPAAVRALIALLSVALVFTMMPLSSGVAHAASGSLVSKTPAVVVTGQGLTGAAYTKANVSNEVSYTLDELMPKRFTPAYLRK